MKEVSEVTHKSEVTPFDGKYKCLKLWKVVNTKMSTQDVPPPPFFPNPSFKENVFTPPPWGVHNVWLAPTPFKRSPSQRHHFRTLVGGRGRGEGATLMVRPMAFLETPL